MMAAVQSSSAKANRIEDNMDTVANTLVEGGLHTIQARSLSVAYLPVKAAVVGTWLYFDTPLTHP